MKSAKTDSSTYPEFTTTSMINEYIKNHRSRIRSTGQKELIMVHDPAYGVLRNRNYLHSRSFSLRFRPFRHHSRILTRTG